MKRLRQLALILAICFQLPALAVSVECDPLLMKYVGFGWEGTGNVDLSSYERYERILFVSDSLNSQKTLSLGKLVSEKYPHKNITSTDFNYQGPAQIGSLKAVSQDNNARFNFPDQSFDLVVLRYGLCVCHGEKCCGGFSPKSPEAEAFFFEVVRVLDRNNLRSQVVLHGDFGISPFILDEWKKFLRRVENKYNVNATIYFRQAGASEFFYSIGIRPRLPTSNDDF